MTPPTNTILWATGIECSYPKVQGGIRRDMLRETGHDRRWREDLALCVELGTRVVRYGLPYYTMHTAPHHHDWSLADEVLPHMRQLGLEPMVDLCHFGVPDWAGDFQNTDWPTLFADFAGAFAQRFPWIRFYTPVNEVLVCAKFSARLGIWNEQFTSDRAMVRAHANMCRATLLAIERIREHRPDALFFQSEATEAFHEQWPQTREQVELLNSMRFLTFDFMYGHAPDGNLLNFLFDQGLDRSEYEWFMQHGRAASPYCVMGMDYYKANERVVHPDGHEQEVGPVLGWQSIARTYYHRYHKPMMLTETNVLDADAAPAWLWSTWHNVQALRRDGVPVLGFTWYSLIDQIDWDIQLRELRNRVNENGLYTLDRTPRAVASALRDLIRRYPELPLLEDFPCGGIPAWSRQQDDA